MNNFRSSFFGSIPPITKNIIIINVIMWLCTLTLPTFFVKMGIRFDITDILGMHYWGSSKFNPAQLVTYMFMHAGFMHMFFNMFGLYMFGGVLEHRLGNKRFLFYYILTGVGAGIIQQLFWEIDIHSIVNEVNASIQQNGIDALNLINSKKEFLNQFITVGASGSIFGILLAFGWLFPEAQMMLLFFPFPIKARIFVAGYAVIELFMGVASFAGDSVAHFAHLGGMLFGLFILLYWKKKNII